MPNILVVDDERVLDLPGAVHVLTCSEAMAFLKGHPVIDELWLDHDLGPDEDVMRLVDHLCEMAFFEMGYEIGRIVVHTMNPVGAENVIRALNRYYPVHRVNVTPYILDINANERV